VRDATATLLASWAGLGLASGFFLWTLGVGAGGPGAPETVLWPYAGSVSVGLGVGGVLAALVRAAAGTAWLARAGYASSLLYLGSLVTLWQPLAWAALAGACSVLVPLRRSDCTNANAPLLLLHAMGSLSGLYVCFQLRTYLATWPAFRDVLAGLWLLVRSVPS